MGFLLSFLLFIPDASRHARQNDADIIWGDGDTTKDEGCTGNAP